MAVPKKDIEAAETKPVALEVQAEGIPAELRNRWQWVCWKYARKDGRWTKVPITSKGRSADSTDSLTWSSCDAALAYYKRHRDVVDGIGYVFTKDDPYSGVDLDDCRNAETGEITDWGQKLIALLDSYTEVSPSRTGGKCFVKASKLPRWKCSKKYKDGKVEIYDKERFFCVTGVCLAGVTIEERQEQLEQVYAEVWGQKSPSSAEVDFDGDGAAPSKKSETTHEITDEMIIGKAMTASNGDKFRALWEGSANGHGGDESSADLALCDYLRFWCGPDKNRIDALFRRSGLMRDKWDAQRGEKTYGERTIDKALDSSEFYDWTSTNGFKATGTTPKNETEDGKSQLSEEIPAAVPTTRWPDDPAPQAFYGLAGDFVRVIEPSTEADPMALLVQLLVCFGNAAGKTAHFRAEGDRHYCNEFAVLVGRTSKGRKGTSQGRVLQAMNGADEQWTKDRVMSGLSSGEGLIWQVRDPIIAREKQREKGGIVSYQDVEKDPGIEDKRLMVFEPEFANVLKQIERQGNTLSAIVRLAWDGKDLKALTKNSPAHSTGAYVSMVGHITFEELKRYLTTTESANGFANRILWVAVERKKVLPEGGPLDHDALRDVQDRLGAALAFARGVGELRRDDGAREVWRDVYEELSTGQPGLVGCMTARAEAHVMRLAMIYALLDLSDEIRPEHMLAAIAVWTYCEESVRAIFGDSTGDDVADEILRLLKATSAGITRTEMMVHFGKNKTSARIAEALGVLLHAGLARMEKEPTKGRETERWFAITKA